MTGMKAVELNAEDSKEFVTLLESNASEDEIEEFLDSKSPKELPEELVPALEIVAKLRNLQTDEINVLATLLGTRQKLMDDLTAILLGDSPQAEETSLISTDQKAPS